MEVLLFKISTHAKASGITQRVKTVEGVKHKGMAKDSF
jgi:hypothetical protein